MIEQFKDAPYYEDQLYAWRALFEGKATEGQQKAAVEWLMHKVCHIGQDDMHENDRVHAYVSGQRSVAVQLAQLRGPLALKLAKKRRGGREQTT